MHGQEPPAVIGSILAGVHIFRHEPRLTTTQQLWLEADAAHGRGDRLGLLLAAALLECGLADRWSGEDDGWDEQHMTLSHWACAAAAWYLKQSVPLALPTGADQQRRLMALTHGPNEVLACAAPEGLKYYGLWPRGYALAARQWQAQAWLTPAWVIGLRTMGGLLAAVVWAALQPTQDAGGHRRLTLRPRGEAWNRHYRLTVRLRSEISAWPGHFLIVDEGPGLSGSSFAGAVGLLTELGVAESRIALLPSWHLDAAAAARLRSPLAARRWLDWKVFPAAPLPGPGGRSLHGGGWRQVFGHREAPVWATHERLKFLERERTVIKFAGLGPYGRTTYAHAQRLARARWGPAIAPDREQAQSGWLRYRRLRARALPARPGRAFAEWAGRYLAWRRAEFALGGACLPSAALAEMLTINLERLRWPVVAPAAAEAVPAAVDGRLQRWEWGATATGWVKFDATDHGDDAFFPGPCDIAWDLAGFEVEFGAALGAAAATTYSRQSGETLRRLAPRLAWHRLAYCAFWAAYCSFAAEQTPAAEAVRFRRAASRYREAVVRASG